MKKIILYFTLLTTFNSFSQQLQNDDFESLNLGNIRNQNYWDICCLDALTTNYQVVSGDDGKILEITSNSDNDLYLWKSDLYNAWANRTNGYDIISFTFDFYSGGESTSESIFKVLLNNDNSIYFGGFSYNPTTKVLEGLGIDDDDDELISFKLGADNNDLVLSANSWSTLVFEFNTVSKEYTWKIAGDITSHTSTAAFSTGTNLNDITFVVNQHATSSSFNYRIDNYSTTSKSSTLSVNKVVNSKFSVLPNPSNGSDFVNFNGDNVQATEAVVFNLLGKKVKTVSQNELANKQINISSLAKGLYILNIETKEGLVTKKIIKN